MKYLFSIGILSFLIIYFLTYCASITAPGGGPRDTIPPILIRSYPENKSLNYSGNSIRLIYDEYLKIENLNKQLIITPIIQEEYEQKIRKNSIELIFPESFLDSTTYTFNFQEAIQDITEGNVTPDNVLAFSTGDYIDSLYINGKVMNLFSNRPVEGFTVCLYQVDDTLDIFNSPPLYLTRTNKEGKYLIENIKNGNYRIYVYNDVNSNLTCDMPREMFGFTSDTLYLNSNVDSIFLKVQYLDMRSIQIQRAGPAGKYYEIKTNKTIVDYAIMPMDTSVTIYHNFGDDRKTIRFYDNIFSADSVEFIFQASDSVENIFVDTLFMKFIETKRDLEEFSLTVTPKNKSQIIDLFSAELRFRKPLKSIHLDSIYFEYDSVTYQYLNDSMKYSLNNRRDVLTFEMELFLSDYIQKLIESDTVSQKRTEDTSPVRGSGGSNPTNKKLMLHIPRGTFISADMDTSTTLVLEYQMLKPENFGSIKGTVNSSFDYFTIQLIKGNKDIVREIHNQKQYEFKTVEPGQYSIRILIDNNSNGKWDPGNIFKNIGPEDIYFFPDELTIRKNWELTDIDLSF